MSTKVSIKWRTASSTQPGFHLYDDCLDGLGVDDGDSEQRVVYLRLDGVAVQLETLPEGGASVTVTLPRRLARELGLLPPSGVVTGA